MRRLGTALLIVLVVLAGAMGLAWLNRIPLTEWVIDTYQPETSLGPVSVRISDLTLSSITVSEFRARYRGPLTAQDVTVEFGFGKDWQFALPSIRIGSLNAALSFADWVDLIDTLAPGPAEKGEDDLPKLPLSIGEMVVETIDLYVETPKGYALLNGAIAFRGGTDLSQENALTRLAEGLEGDLLLSAGAVGFPVQGGAKGGGFLVLAASFAEQTAKIEAVTPLRIDLEIAEPLAALPELPPGIYRADIGTDEAPFRLTAGYGADTSLSLRTLSFEPFPFTLDTPFGTAEAHTTTAPLSVAEAQADPAALPVKMTGLLNLSGVPLPGMVKADIHGGFEFDKGKRTTVKFDKGFQASVTLSESPYLIDLPGAVLDMIGDTVTVTAKNTLAIEIVTDGDGNRFTGTGGLVTESGGLSASLPSDFEIFLQPAGEFLAETKALTIALAPGHGPVSGRASFNDLTAAQGSNGSARASARFQIQTDRLTTEGALSATRTADGTKVTITDAGADVPGPGLTAPAFDATFRIDDDGIDLSAAVQEVRLGDLRVLKRPLVLLGNAKPDANGDVDFNLSGSIDDVVAVHAKGHYIGGDLVMSFGSGDIPLGPGGADLSELTDLVDLGRSDPNGSIRIDGELTYQNGAVSGYADLQIAEIGSVLTDGIAVSVLGTITFDLSRPPATLSPATLTGSLSSDILGTIPFKETFSLRETGEMEVQSLEAQFLGGTVTIREGLANAAAGSMTGRAHAAAIDLDALADLLNIEGLEGTGSLTGDLAFRVSEEAVVVERGELKAENPGVLRYRGEALRAAAQGNENLALLVQALENFHYEVLTLGIDIPEFGEGIVTLHLEGNNPDVLEGYPFDVTINLESEYGRLIKTFLTIYNEMDVILQKALR